MRPAIDLKLLSQRESEQVEWKENVADPDDVVATLCAFANDLRGRVRERVRGCSQISYWLRSCPAAPPSGEDARSPVTDFTSARVLT